MTESEIGATMEEAEYDVSDATSSIDYDAVFDKEQVIKVCEAEPPPNADKLAAVRSGMMNWMTDAKRAVSAKAEEVVGSMMRTCATYGQAAFKTYATSRKAIVGVQTDQRLASLRVVHDVEGSSLARTRAELMRNLNPTNEACVSRLGLGHLIYSDGLEINGYAAEIPFHTDTELGILRKVGYQELICATGQPCALEDDSVNKLVPGAMYIRRSCTLWKALTNETRYSHVFGGMLFFMVPIAARNLIANGRHRAQYYPDLKLDRFFTTVITGLKVTIGKPTTSVVSQNMRQAMLDYAIKYNMPNSQQDVAAITRGFLYSTPRVRVASVFGLLLMLQARRFVLQYAEDELGVGLAGIHARLDPCLRKHGGGGSVCSNWASVAAGGLAAVAQQGVKLSWYCMTRAKVLAEGQTAAAATLLANHSQEELLNRVHRGLENGVYVWVLREASAWNYEVMRVLTLLGSAEPGTQYYMSGGTAINPGGRAFVREMVDVAGEMNAIRECAFIKEVVVLMAFELKVDELRVMRNVHVLPDVHGILSLGVVSYPPDWLSSRGVLQWADYPSEAAIMEAAQCVARDFGSVMFSMVMVQQVRAYVMRALGPLNGKSGDEDWGTVEDRRTMGVDMYRRDQYKWPSVSCAGVFAAIGREEEAQEMDVKVVTKVMSEFSSDKCRAVDIMRFLIADGLATVMSWQLTDAELGQPATAYTSAANVEAAHSPDCDHPVPWIQPANTMDWGDGRDEGRIGPAAIRGGKRNCLRFIEHADGQVNIFGEWSKRMHAGALSTPALLIAFQQARLPGPGRFGVRTSMPAVFDAFAHAPLNCIFANHINAQIPCSPFRSTLFGSASEESCTYDAEEVAVAKVKGKLDAAAANEWAEHVKLIGESSGVVSVELDPPGAVGPEDKRISVHYCGLIDKLCGIGLPDIEPGEVESRVALMDAEPRNSTRRDDYIGEFNHWKYLPEGCAGRMWRVGGAIPQKDVGTNGLRKVAFLNLLGRSYAWSEMMCDYVPDVRPTTTRANALLGVTGGRKCAGWRIVLTHDHIYEDETMPARERFEHRICAGSEFGGLTTAFVKAGGNLTETIILTATAVGSSMGLAVEALRKGYERVADSNRDALRRRSD